MRKTAADSRAERDAAISRVSAAADAYCDGWLEVAQEGLRRFIAAQPLGAVFTSCDVRERMGELGVPEPHDKRAWGSVYLAMAKAGLIERDGFAPSRYRHQAPTRAWKRIA